MGCLNWGSQQVSLEARDGVTQLGETERESRRVASRLKLYFAILSCLGGLVLSVGNGGESIPVIAIFFAVFGYLFVDWLELFALPTIAAYAAMAVAALYCISDFSNLDSPGNRQMAAVAQLLVFVQAILMLQRKNRRIFEQLGVFCLLELVVAAVFNNAMNYGILLIPIGIVGAWALSLLSVVSAWDGMDEASGLSELEPALRLPGKSPPAMGRGAKISIATHDSVQSFARCARRLPRLALYTLAPAVLLVGAIFFYALPRTTDAARVTGAGSALTGFSDHVRLGEIGQMMQSSEVALRIDLQHERTRRPYRVASGLYLRGRVLERYETRGAIWSSNGPSLVGGTQRLPPEFAPRKTDRNFYDPVAVSVTCEAMRRSDSLFAIAPYHRRGAHPEIVHAFDCWTVGRTSSAESSYPRISYALGTNAFRGGVQTDLIARHSVADLALIAESPIARRELREYNERLLQLNQDMVPTAVRLADGISSVIPDERRTEYEVAKRLERYLALDGNFSYTLNLTAKPKPGVDPIEQFLRDDRRGHCQYFASALVMMLRSQGIPARIVVGYRTDEYNDLGRYYVARQLHAHAWVEGADRTRSAPFDESRLRSTPM